MEHLGHGAWRAILIMFVTSSSHSKSGIEILEMSNIIVLDSDTLGGLHFKFALCATNMLGWYLNSTEVRLVPHGI